MCFHVSHSHEPKLKKNPHFSNSETKNVLVNSQLVTFEPKNNNNNKKQKNKTKKKHFLFIELQA